MGLQGRTVDGLDEGLDLLVAGFAARDNEIARLAVDTNRELRGGRGLALIAAAAAFDAKNVRDHVRGSAGAPVLLGFDVILLNVPYDVVDVLDVGIEDRDHPRRAFPQRGRQFPGIEDLQHLVDLFNLVSRSGDEQRVVGRVGDHADATGA